MKKLNLLIIISTIYIGCGGNTEKIYDEEPLVRPAPISVEGLRKRSFNAQLNFEKELQGAQGFSSELRSYYSDSLKIFVLVNIPKTPRPANGYPILIFGHGFHPEPKKYGISASTGKDWRPGDYYRGIPESFAERGFMVLTPDYRGHNVSEGFEFTQMGFLAHNFYTVDLLHLVAALGSLESANLDKVFFIGHSMGGDVGLRLLLTTDKIKAASLWAPVAATTWSQALYYGRYYDKEGEMVDEQKMQVYTTRLRKALNDLEYDYSVEYGDPINFIEELNVPLIIHHSIDDSSVPYMWSEGLVSRLFTHGKQFEFYAYKSSNHLFMDENRVLAFDRDTRFFNKYSKQN